MSSATTTELSQRQIPFDWLWRWFNGVAELIEHRGAALARRKALAVIFIAAATILVRLSLLPVLPVPVPTVHDEFSYLLAADTFAHGRLTNPPHPMSIYLETFHVNQRPTYMSIYPPAQGAALAVGELLGNPWIGVLLSVAALCAGIVWMLQGWMPPNWALLGGVLALLRLGLFGYWMNSYWGGAVAAVGGALVVGALPRILCHHRTGDAVILGVGTAILANSRPFEGAVFCLPVFLLLGIWLFSRRSPSWRKTVPKVVTPLCVVGLFCLAFMGYYNWRGTGNPLVFPYELNVSTHMAVPQFLWQKTRPPFHFAIPQFETYYNVWWPKAAWSLGRPDSMARLLIILRSDVATFCSMFLWPELCVPLIALPWAFTNRKTLFLLIQAALCFGGFLLVALFQPHYAAPLTATVLAIVMQSMRHLRKWKIKSLPIGVAISRLFFLWALLLVPSHTLWQFSVASRSPFEKQLEALPGKQLVIVRYSPNHNVHAEWVFNRADIDSAKIVWAREIPGISDAPLIDYFRDRHVWIVQPDSPIGESH